MVNNPSVAVLGAGSWGTALAIVLARNGFPTRLWGHDPEHMREVKEAHCNARYFPDVKLPDNLVPEASLAEAVRGVKDVLLVVPSQAFRGLLEQLQPLLDKETRIFWATKGLEPNTGKMFHQVVAEIFGTWMPVAVISGPSFAKEVVAGLPTAITVAASSKQYKEDIKHYFHHKNFRVYNNRDLIGVQIGGAVKNVLAIAAGISDGLGYGANARCALVTRGLSEMMRLGVACGGVPETFMGLAGLGDLVLTCTDNQSRNRRFGVALGQNKSLQQAKDEIGQVVEGIDATAVIYELAKKISVEMPIVEQVYRVIYQNVAPAGAVDALLRRESGEEFQFQSGMVERHG